MVNYSRLHPRLLIRFERFLINNRTPPFFMYCVINLHGNDITNNFLSQSSKKFGQVDYRVFIYKIQQ